MDESNADSEREYRIDEIDARTDSPHVCAQRIWNILRQHAPNETNWDILCFAVEYIGMLVPECPWLEDVAKPLAVRVYTAHYAKEGLYDAPRGRPEATTQPEYRRPNMGAGQKENSNRLILESGFIGGRKKNAESALHLRDNPADSTESRGPQTTGNDVGGDSGCDARRDD